MKKKIIALFIASFMIVNVVSAAGLWGTYGGNNIINLTVGGTPVTVTDVPAINYKGRTMIPIYLLQQAGVRYTWDQESQTVDVETPMVVEVADNSASDAKAWLKFYFEVTDALRVLLDMTRSVSELSFLSGDPLSNVNQKVDPEPAFKAADELYKKIKTFYDKQSKYYGDLGIDMKNSGLDPTELMKSYALIGEAIEANLKVTTSLRQYFTTSYNKNYYDDYVYYSNKAFEKNSESYDLTNKIYMDYATLIRAYY